MKEQKKKLKLKYDTVRYLLMVVIITVLLSMNYQTLIILAAQELTSEEITQEENSASTDNNNIELLDADTLIGKDAKVSSAQIIQTRTGTGPWDDNDEAGNDSSEVNNIVRSFDQVTWTVDVTMSLKETTESSLTGGTIRVSVSLPEYCANVVTWDLDSMKWIEDGTVSTDGRTLTGKYNMPGTEITVPGKQTLIFVLKIFGAANRTEIVPTFNFSIDGNSENEIVELKGDTIFVSAKGKYNIQLVRNDWLAKKVTVDYGNGDTLGRMYGYSFALQLYNEDESKGLKGIEYPKGKITLDINLTLQRSQFESAELEDITPECTPILWNYRVSNWTKSTIGEIKDREMFSIDSQYYMYDIKLPVGIYVNDKYSTYNSGNISIIQEGRKLKVSVSDYDFNGTFPHYEANYNGAIDSGRDKIYTENIGTFSIGYMQIFVPDNDASTIESSNYFLKVSDDNMNIKTVSGENITNQMQTLDDSSNVQHVIYRKRSYAQQIIPYDRKTNKILESYYSEGDAKATVGQEIEISTKFVIGANNEEDIYTANRFIKFDGDGYEPDYYSNGDKYRWSALVEGSPKFRIWYVTKKDGTNWISQTEMNNANIEDMDIYDNIEDIPEEKICIGVYVETISGYIHKAISTGGKQLTIPLKIKENATIGQTYGITQRTQLWVEKLDRNVYSVLHIENEYPEAEWDSGNKEYIKVEYDENGKIISGTHKGGFQWGETILVIGANLHGSINAIDETGAYKVNYNLGKNENTVTYNIEPQIDKNDNITTQISDITLKTEITLPEGIKYKVGTSKRGEDTYTEPEITINSDGTTTLVWNIYGCTSGQTITPITFEAQIDNESENGEQYTATLIISEVIGKDGRSKIGNSEIKNRKSSETINIINLASHRLYKEIETPVIEKNGEITFKITYENKTEETISEFQLLDILPYNGDNRGTLYTGTYTLNQVTIKKSKDGVEQSNSNLKTYITSSEAVREIDSKNTEIGISGIWTEKTSGQTIGEKATGIAIKGEVLGKEKIEIEIVLTTIQNAEEDVYANNAMAQVYSNSEQMQTGNIRATVVNRIIEGKVWFDKNKNGIIDNEEKYMPGIKVSLINEDGTEALDVNGQIIGGQVTDENGYYSFENIKKGNYKVLVKIEDDRYEITKKDIGSNEEINNKFNLECLTDIITNLNNSDFPLVIVKNVNAGITYKDTSVLVHHYIEGTTTKISNDVVIPGLIEDEYNTSVANDIPVNYEVALVPNNAKGTMTKEQIEVNYYYKLKTPSIKNSEISKNTTVEKITDIEEKIPYTINYKAIVDKYMGNAKLTIIDELPYKIDVAMSDLQGGVYDSINKTITWTENITNIDTFLNGEKEIGITKNIEIVYDIIDVNDKEVKNTVKASLELGTPVAVDTIETMKSVQTEYLVNITVNKNWVDNNNSYDKRPQNVILQIKNEQTQEIVQSYNLAKSESSHTFTGLAKYNSQGEKIQYVVEEKEAKEGDLCYYSIQVGQMQEIKQDNREVVITNTMTKIPGNVIVKYVDKKTNEEISEQLQKEGIVGEEFDVSNDKKEIPEYMLIEEPEEKTGIYTNDTQVKTYYYVHISAGVIEKHIDYVSGEILLSNKYNGNEGDFYTTTAKDFENYDLIESDKDGNSLLPDNAQGKMKKEITEVNYYYKKKSKVIVEYIDKTTNEKIQDDIIIYGHESDIYNTDKKEIKYYNFVESTDNTTGNMAKETIIVKYYYEKQIFNFKIDKWIESININGNTKQAQTIDTKDKIYKIDINKKDVSSTDLKITYKIRISNDGEIEGNIKSISEIIPSGYSFYQEDNEIKWTQENGVLMTKDLAGEILKPGEYKELLIVYRWNRNLENFGLKTNTAKIVETDNPAGFVDGNKEDDSSISKVLLSVTTGASIENKIVIIIITGALAMLGIAMVVVISYKRKIK